ncbi:PepSY-associated TM helix domain-containing protein [Leucothrix pacifica]|uniref:PepSY domain-containing protein n=1 Tax=Leucothrix pacifica TaxID=1247513 RepID=A0A317CIG6_9GAMM|nr:PepSY-associated TM helix domain-containing protein [Leucothrix pacifica]PWQ97971.1 hypothetical protein DKW60_09100 [Leucothrix pacifica]
MSFKRIIFWAHLIAGVIAGLLIFTMSVTGVLLTYERQIIDMADRNYYVEPAAGATPLTLDQLSESVKQLTDNKPGVSLVFSDTPNTPVVAKISRRQQLLIDPYTGESLGPGASGVRQFFSVITDFHRWLAFTGESRNTGKSLTGAANLLFLFIIISGIYIWLPKLWRWNIVKSKLLFRRKLPNAKARDYNWHNVMGIWMVIPLFFIVTTAVVFSYSWANKLVFQVYGEEAPTRRGPPGNNNQAGKGGKNAAAQQTDTTVSMQNVLDSAKAYSVDWEKVSITLPAAGAQTIEATVDTGTGGEPTKQTQLTLNANDGTISRVSTFSDRTPGVQTRIYIRYLHTGESLGIIGQTIAGLASLAACFMVYTGLALAYRRLIQPLFVRRRKVKAA